MDIFKLENWNEETLQSLVNNGVEESTYLEFKRAAALGKSDGVKDEVAKDVSAFANSDGGILIYGINEVDHKAASFDFVDGDTFNKEWLELVITTAISRKIDGIKIFPVRVNNDVKKTVYVIKIPVSYSAPHMVSRKKSYYKRYNFMAVPMEEYEVRQTYDRKENVKLAFGLINVTVLNESEYFDDGWAYSNDDATLNFDIVVSIINIGNTVAEKYKVKAQFLFGSYNFITFTNNEYIQTSSVLLNSISTNAVAPIYPKEDLTGLRITLKSEYIRGGKDELINHFPIDFYLYFNNEVVTQRLTLLTYTDKLENRNSRKKAFE